MKLRTLTALASLAVITTISLPTISAATLKKIVAVSRFDNKTAYSQATIGDGMADQLTDALMQSGKFIVMERQNVKDVIKEEDFANSGRVLKAKSAQTGKLVAAQILVQGTITEFENSSGGSQSGVGFAGIHIGNNHQEAHVGLIIRLIDTTTGEVLASQRGEGKVKSGGMKLGLSAGGAQFGTSGFEKTPMGKAVQMAIDDAVNQISEKLKDVPFQARVIKVNGDDEFLVSGGEKTGMAAGDAFTLYSVGEDLGDPTTGEQLGAEVTKKGVVKVTSVQEKYAKAKPDAPIAGVKVGDIIKAQ